MTNYLIKSKVVALDSDLERQVYALRLVGLNNKSIAEIINIRNVDIVKRILDRIRGKGWTFDRSAINNCLSYDFDYFAVLILACLRSLNIALKVSRDRNDFAELIGIRGLTGYRVRLMEALEFLERNNCSRVVTGNYYTLSLKANVELHEALKAFVRRILLELGLDLDRDVRESKSMDEPDFIVKGKILVEVETEVMGLDELHKKTTDRFNSIRNLSYEIILAMSRELKCMILRNLKKIKYPRDKVKVVIPKTLKRTLYNLL